MKAQKQQIPGQKASPSSQKGSSQKSSIPKKQKKIEQQLLEEEFEEDVDELEQELEAVAALEDSAGEADNTITDKEFYKAMQKLKDRGTNAVPPKKSASAYIIFGKEKRAEILKRNPLAKVTEVVKEIAQSWGLLNKEERQKYKEAAKKDKERYEKELRSLESFSEKLKKPKKCLSAYMIFVKETRPIIVEEHPEMGALQVMQEVGKKWQSLTKEERQYFKTKADKDKVRYLKEQKAFYDEVEKIGQKVGTVTTKEGQVAVNSNFYSTDQSKQAKVKKNLMPAPSEKSEDSILAKRKLPSQKTSVTESPLKRRAHTQEEIKEPSNNPNKISVQLPSQTQSENKPKKPLSAYIYFSQEFREIIRQRFPFLTVQQIMNAVSYRWQNLTKEQKSPFEQIAVEDKQRYDREVQVFKKGQFMGRSQTPQIRISNENENVSTALEISEDLLKFLQVKTQNGESETKLEEQQEFPNEEEEANEDLYGEENDDELNEYQSQKNKSDSSKQPPTHLGSSNFNVVIENLDENQIRNRKDSLINPLSSMKYEGDEQPPELMKEIHHMVGHQMDPNHYPYQAPYHLDPMAQKGYAQYAHYQQLQSALGPQFTQSAFQFDGKNLLQSEFTKRESDRKTSMSFGFGQGFYQAPGNITQSPAFTSHLLNSPMMLQQTPGNSFMVNDSMGFMMGGQPFQLPPSNHQMTQPQASNPGQYIRQSGPGGAQSSTTQNSSQMPPPQNFMKISNSPQLGPSSLQPQNPPMFVNQYLSTQQSDTFQGQSLSPFLTPQNPQQLLFPQF